MGGLFKRIGVTAAIAIGAYVVGLNVLHPWQGLQLSASSDLDFDIAIAFAAISALVCASRLMRGAEAGTELRRFWDALSDETDQG